MGYYTGSGVIVGGGETNNVLRSFMILGGGSFQVRQENVFSTKKFSGVSLETAQNSHESGSFSPIYGGSGAYAWICFDASGTRVTPSYSRIGDSNLYELNVTTENLTAYISNTL